MDGGTRTASAGGSREILPAPVRRAVAHMRQQIGAPLTLSDVVAAAGVPERTLHAQFRRFLGTTPAGHLRAIRLAAAREALLAAGPDCSVTTVAAEHGFNHFGRFATVYRKAFDELPSATLVRACAARAEPTPAHASPLRPSRAKPELLLVPLAGATREDLAFADHLLEHIAARVCRTSVASVRVTRCAHSHTLLLDRREIAARYCLTGRVAQEGTRIRVTMRLLDIAEDQHLWGDSIDGPTDELFALQDRVAEGVVRGVIPRLSDAEFARAAAKHPDVVRARDLALQAIRIVRAADVPSARRALELLERAMALDPDDALPPALAAVCYAQLFNYHGVLSLCSNSVLPPGPRDTARNLLRRARLLDTGDSLVVTASAAASGLLATGGCRLPQDVETAVSLASRAVAMDPTSAWAWERWAYARLRSGGPAKQVTAFFRQALRLKEPSASASNSLNGIGELCCAGGRWEIAGACFRRALAENPRATWMIGSIALTSLKAGDATAARQWVTELRRNHPGLCVRNLPPSHAALAEVGLPL